MNKSSAGRWGWLGLLMLLAACGGQVTDEGKQPGRDPDDDDEDGQTTTGGDTGGGAVTGGGITCAGAKPHPNYSQCYETSYPPCLELSSSELLERLGVAVRPTAGPWVGTRNDCKMLCCYGSN